MSQTNVQPNAFDQTTAPIFSAHCLECHSEEHPKGKLNLSRRATAFREGESGPAILVGDLDESLIGETIEADDMPPKRALSEADKHVIRESIGARAKWVSDVTCANGSCG